MMEGCIPHQYKISSAQVLMIIQGRKIYYANGLGLRLVLFIVFLFSMTDTFHVNYLS